MRAIIRGAILLTLSCLGAQIAFGADPSTHGRLDQLLAKADLVLIGQAVASAPITNSAFHIPTMDVHATQFKVVSVLQGTPPGDVVVFQHYSRGPTGGWSGPSPPAYYVLTPGETCLIFAASTDKPDSYYTPEPDVSHPGNEFRQIADFPKHPEDGLIRTLDARPFVGIPVKDAVWRELNLMLRDTHPRNALYAIERLDAFSVAQGRHVNAFDHTDDFKRADVLDALLPLLTNSDERVANRAIDCFAEDAGSPLMTAAYVAPLVRAANESPSPWTRFYAAKALADGNNTMMTNALARLLADPDKNIRLSAVTLLPGFPRDFAVAALRERAKDASPFVRSVVADVIGEGQYAGDLPELAELFAGSTNLPFIQQKPLPAQALNPRLGGNGMGDVHGSAAEALTRFDVDQVAAILKSNLNDAVYHVLFVAKLAEKDAGPWLMELTNIIQTRVNYANDVAKSDPMDPRRYSDPTATWTLTGVYLSCWEDVCHYLAGLPREKLAGSDLAPCLDLMVNAIQTNQSVSSQPAHELYDLCLTKGLTDRATVIRQKFPNDKWWFDDFDHQHSEPKATAK